MYDTSKGMRILLSDYRSAVEVCPEPKPSEHRSKIADASTSSSSKSSNGGVVVVIHTIRRYMPASIATSENMPLPLSKHRTTP